MKFGYQGNYWRDDREQHVNSQSLGYIGISIPGRAVLPDLDQRVHQPVHRQRARGCRRRSSRRTVDDEPPHAAGRAPLRPSLELVPGADEPEAAVLPRRDLPRTDGVTGYNDITPRMGAAYDLFGNGKTALKVNLGKYLQGASVSNLAYGANPALRIPFGGGLSTTGLCFFGALGFSNPCVVAELDSTRLRLTPDCNLDNPLANGECGQIDNLQFGSNQLVGAQFDPGLFSGWGVRPSDWSFGVSVQQQLFPRASVEVGYYRRSFTQYFTGGTVTDNLAISPSDVGTYSARACPNDPRLPNGGATVGGLYDVNPNVFGQVEPADQVHEGRG